MNPILDRLMRRDLIHFTPYQSAKRSSAQKTILLNANESPWAMDFNLPPLSLNRYQKNKDQKIIEKITDYYQLHGLNILLTRGGDEAIDLIIRLFCAAGQDQILITPPTYNMYAVSANIQGATILKVPLVAENNYQLNVAAIEKAMTPNTKVIMLCSPNNPTGNTLNVKDVSALCEKYRNDCMIMIDEAYYDYSNQTSFAELISDYENLLVIRTFSKAFGLAALRCGFIIAQGSIIQALKNILAPYPLPSFTYEVLETALSKPYLTEVNHHINMIKEYREKLMAYLNTLSFIQQVYPSQANFILVKVENSDGLFQHCEQHGILLRHGSQWSGLENYIRITLGTPEENETLIQVLKEFEKWTI